MVREEKDRQRERKKERKRERGRGLRVEVEKRWTEIEVENNYEDSVSSIRIECSTRTSQINHLSSRSP